MDLRASDWQILRRLVVFTGLVVGVIFGSYVIVSELWKNNITNEYNIKYIQDTLGLIGFHLSSLDYQAASSLAETLLKRDAIEKILIKDNYGYSIFDSIVEKPDTQTVSTTEYKIFSSNLADEQQVGTAYIALKTASLTNIISWAIAQGLFIFLIIFSSCTVILKYYFMNYIITPLTVLNSAMEETTLTGRHKKVNYFENTQFGALARNFNVMQAELEGITKSKENLLKQKQLIADELENSVQNVKIEQQKQKTQIENIGEVLHSIDQSISYFNDKKQLVHANVGNTYSPVITDILKQPVLTADQAIAYLDRHNVNIKVVYLSDQPDLEYGTLYVLEIQDPDNIWRLQAIKLKNGSTALLSNNITELRKVENKLYHARKMETLGILTSGVAHEFNNMLAIMISCIELLQVDDTASTKHEKIIPVFLRASDRASATVKQLLAYSSESIIEPVNIDLRDFMHGLEPMLNNALGPHIDLSIKVDTNYLVHADPKILDSTFINLAANSRDAMLDGGTMCIHVRCANQQEVRNAGYDSNQTLIVFDVIDNGKGIKKSIMDNIFDPFFTTKLDGKGTGLGLSTVFGYVAQLGGNITCNSEIDVGTHFKIFLPAVKEQAKVEIELPKKKIDSGLQGMKILLMDDEKDILDVTAELLALHGARMNCAQSVKNALSVINTTKAEDFFDVVICDLHMKDGKGTDVFNYLKSTDKQTKKILISGNVERNNNQYLLCDKVLRKPVSIDDMIRAIQDLVFSNTK